MYFFKSLWGTLSMSSVVVKGIQLQALLHKIKANKPGRTRPAVVVELTNEMLDRHFYLHKVHTREHFIQNATLQWELLWEALHIPRLDDFLFDAEEFIGATLSGW